LRAVVAFVTFRLFFNPLTGPTPGRGWKAAEFGQLPKFPGSPPILTHFACDGVAPSSTNIRYQPIGAIYGPFGAVTVHVFPAQDTRGNRMRAPIELPCVLDSEPSSETFIAPPDEDVKVKA
jgi:hypothetical protein